MTLKCQRSPSVEQCQNEFNRYAYGNNNPYVYLDRNGREAQSVLGDVPANPKPGTGTWITAGIIAAPLGVGETSVGYKTRATLRTLEDIVMASDLAYCLHWAINQARLDAITLPGNIEPYIIIERRKALDWMLSRDDWDEVNLDT